MKYRNSTIVGSPGTRIVRRITRRGSVASGEPGEGVLHPSTQSSAGAPLVGGGRAGSAGGVGDVSVGVDDGNDGASVGDGLLGNSVSSARSHPARSANARRRTALFIVTRGRGQDIGAWYNRARMHPDPDAGHEPDPGHPRPVSRRRFLQRSAMAVAGGVLFACTGGRGIPKTVDPTPSIDTRWPIKRVVYLMLENRSFNNIFGRFPGVEGATVGVENGLEKPLIRCPEWLPGDLPHDQAAHRNSLNDGAMDGFGTGIFGSVYGYSAFMEDQIPNYWHWAREYAISDHFFASAAGPSYPNHFFFVAGTSGGVIDNPEGIKTRPLEDGTTFKSWGCDAVGDDRFVFVRDPKGNLTKHSTCFEFPTVGEQLTESGLDWAYYSAVPGQPGYFWNAYNGISNVFHSDLWHEHVRPVDRLLEDIEAERLPPVTWVTPRFQLSDHPPFSTGHAHNWVTGIVNRLMRSSMWEHTAIFLTWDEWGGVLRSGGPAGGRSGRPGDPGADADDLPVRPARRDRRRGRRVLDPPPVHLRQLGARAAHGPDPQHAQLRARLRLPPEASEARVRNGAGTDVRQRVRVARRHVPGLAARNHTGRRSALGAPDDLVVRGGRLTLDQEAIVLEIADGTRILVGAIPPSDGRRTATPSRA